ncbi:unnamed protein product, partial [Mesorhabditis spiculigera]
MSLIERLRLRVGIGNELYRATLAELFATGFLVFAGTCVNAQHVLSSGRYNAWIGVCVGWGLALAFAVQMAYRVSGAHLNPAVSFFQLTQGKISPLRFILFVIAQNVGAFFGAVLTFLVYYDKINSYDRGRRFVTGANRTANIFGTFPERHLSVLGGLFDQVVGTAVLCMLIACVVDRRNRIPPFMQPAFIGTILILIGMTLGMNAGYAINPARDFGPRLFTLIAGYGWGVFSYNRYKWFWIPWVGPMIGAVIGAWLYEFFIGFHIPDDPDTSYIHRIVDDRNPEGNLREIHLIETRPASERHDPPPPQQIAAQSQKPTSYRNL